MKTHHLGNLILILVLITALAGLYYMYKGPGLAIQQPYVTVEELGFCCCQDEISLFRVPSSLLSSDANLEADCTAKCREHGSTSKPVLPLGPC